MFCVVENVFVNVGFSYVFFKDELHLVSNTYAGSFYKKNTAFISQCVSLQTSATIQSIHSEKPNRTRKTRNEPKCTSLCAVAAGTR